MSAEDSGIHVSWNLEDCMLEAWMLDRGQKMAMGIRVPVHANVLEHKSRVDARILGSEGKLLGMLCSKLCGMLCGLVTLDCGIPAGLSSLLARISLGSVLCE